VSWFESSPGIQRGVVQEASEFIEFSPQHELAILLITFVNTFRKLRASKSSYAR
jgi:hypothetical protein